MPYSISESTKNLIDGKSILKAIAKGVGSRILSLLAFVLLQLVYLYYL